MNPPQRNILKIERVVMILQDVLIGKVEISDFLKFPVQIVITIQKGRIADKTKTKRD